MLLKFGIVNVISDKIWFEVEFIVGEEEDSMFSDVINMLRNL